MARPSSLTPAVRAAIRYLWEETGTTASRIAALHGTTKNVVMGMVARDGWTPRHPANQHGACGSPSAVPETVFDRMAVLEATMAAVLAETAPAARYYRRDE